MKDGFLEEAVDVCGETWDIAIKTKIWWWNEKGATLVKENQLTFYGKDLRSTRKDANVGKHEGESCAGVGRTAKNEDMETIRRRQAYNLAKVLLRELSPRQ